MIRNLFKKKFGSCCKDLKNAINTPPNSFFMVEDNGILYLTIGYVNTEEGPGFYDQAVIFCPFCGEKIQDKAEIAKKTR